VVLNGLIPTQAFSVMTAPPPPGKEVSAVLSILDFIFSLTLVIISHHYCMEQSPVGLF